MPQISSSEGFATVFVFFKTNPKEQKKLLDHAISNSKTVMANKPGFISTSIYKNSDDSKIVSMSQWKNLSSYEKAISYLTPKEVLLGEKMMEMGATDWNTYQLSFCLGKNTTKISMNNNVKTIINLFTVDSSDQKKLIQNLLEFSSSKIEKNPDFISGAIYQSFDGKKVISYSQWRSKVSYQQLHTDFTNTDYNKINEISEFEWDFFDLVYTS